MDRGESEFDLVARFRGLDNTMPWRHRGGTSMRRQQATMAALAVISLWLGGCQKDADSELVGVWKGAGAAGTEILSFRADGSMVITSTGGDNDVYGTWKMAEGKINIHEQLHGQNIELEVISLGKDELNIRTSAGGKVVTLSRVADRPSPPSKAELFAATPEGKRAFQERQALVMATYVDKAVLNNARMLAAAADQFFLENGVTSVTQGSLVGATNYIKALNLVSNETYP